jgi:hypothetical protein
VREASLTVARISALVSRSYNICWEICRWMGKPEGWRAVVYAYSRSIPELLPLHGTGTRLYLKYV